jgi:hypothetical protein
MLHVNLVKQENAKVLLADGFEIGNQQSGGLSYKDLSGLFSQLLNAVRDHRDECGREGRTRPIPPMDPKKMLELVASITNNRRLLREQKEKQESREKNNSCRESESWPPPDLCAPEHDDSSSTEERGLPSSKQTSPQKVLFFKKSQKVKEPQSRENDGDLLPQNRAVKKRGTERSPVAMERPPSKGLSFDEDAWTSSSSDESGEETDELSPKDGADFNQAARASEGMPIRRQLSIERSRKIRPKVLDDESRSVTSNKSVNSKKSQLGKKSVATNDSAAKN